MEWRGIKKKDVIIFKGIAIIFIVAHNFLHRFPYPKENEMDFSQERFFSLIDIFLNEQGAIPRAMFSYFGHFGVQFFVFLSAYGLTKKHIREPITNSLSFLFNRLIKLYPIFITSILFYLIYVGIIRNFYILNTDALHNIILFILDIYKALLLKLTLLWGLYPGQGFSLVGPWWFLSMIFQFYIIYPLILNLTNRFGNVILLIISIISIFIIYYGNGFIFNVNVFFTVVGHMPLLSLGIYMAINEKISIKNYVFIIFFILFMLGNIYHHFFLFSHFSFFIISFALIYKIKDKINNKYKIESVLIYFGKISLSLFLVNGFMRYPLEGIAQSINNEGVILILCMIFFVQCIFASNLLLFINNKYIEPIILRCIKKQPTI